MAFRMAQDLGEVRLDTIDSQETEAEAGTQTLVGLDRQWEAGQDSIGNGSIPVDRSLRLHLALCMMDAIMTIGSK